MNIALFGYGKMGQAIEKIATDRGHQIVLKVSSSDDIYTLQNCDVAIDFSLPSTAVANISACINSNIPHSGYLSINFQGDALYHHPCVYIRKKACHSSVPSCAGVDSELGVVIHTGVQISYHV